MATPARVAIVVALGLLAESFGRDVYWLWSHRHATLAPTAPVTDGEREAGAEPPHGDARGRARAGIAAVLTILALLVVWIALVAPDQLGRLTPGAFVRLPLEGLALIALALALPVRARRLLAGAVGPVLGLLVIVKILDMGFFEAFDRPFDPVADGSYTGIGIETLRDSIGRTYANLLVAGAALLGVGLLVVTTLALLRVTRVAAGRRRWSLPALAALGALWLLCWALGAQLGTGAPIASASAAGLVLHEVRAVHAGVEDHAVFADEIRHDRFAGTAGDELLTGLRGKDVLLVFVESYGQSAVQDSSFAPGVDAALARETAGCRPPASPHGAASSPRRRSADSAGSRTRRCSRGSGSTTSGATTSSSRPTASRSPPRSRGPGGGPSATRRPTTGHGRRGRRSTTSTSSTTGATSGITARGSRTRRCRTSTCCWPCNASSSRSGTVGTSSRRSTWCRATRRGHASPG